MKKLENLFRRVLSMVLCLSMLMGNMGGALAADPYTSNVADNTDLAAQVVSTSDVSLSMDFKGIRKVAYDAELKQSGWLRNYHAYYEVTATVGGPLLEARIKFDHGFAAAGAPVFSNLPEGVAATWSAGDSSIVLSAAAGGSVPIPEEGFTFIVGVPLQDSAVAGLLDGNVVTSKVSTTVGGGSSASETVALNPQVSFTQQGVDANGNASDKPTHYKWTLNYSCEGIQLTNTYLTATVSAGDILTWKDTPQLSVQSLGTGIRGNETVDGSTITFGPLTGYNGDNKAANTNLEVIFYSEAVDTDVICNLTLKPENVGTVRNLSATTVSDIALSKVGKAVVVNGEKVVQWTVKLNHTNAIQNVTLNDTFEGTNLKVGNDTPVTITGLNGGTWTAVDEGQLNNTNDAVAFTPKKDESNNTVGFDLAIDQNEAAQVTLTYYTSVEKTNVDATINYFEQNTADIQNVAELNAPDKLVNSVSAKVSDTVKTLKVSVNTLDAATGTPIAIHAPLNLLVSAVDATGKKLVTSPMELKMMEGNATFQSGLMYDPRTGAKPCLLVPAKEGTDTAAEHESYITVNGTNYKPYLLNDVLYLNASGQSDATTADFFQVAQMAENGGELIITLINDKSIGLEGMSQAYRSGSFTVNTTKNEFMNGGYQYDPNNYLGVAGNFHIVAFEKVWNGGESQGSHVNGNMLAKELYSTNNFGTNGLGFEVTYIQKYCGTTAVLASSDNHLLVLGSENEFALTENNMKIKTGEGSVTLDRPKNIMVDADTATNPFIDLNAVESDIKAFSSELNGTEDTGISVDFHDQNSRTLTLNSADSTGYITFTSSQLNEIKNNPLYLKGFKAGHKGSIVINVVCDTNTVYMPQKAQIFMDGSSNPEGTGEVTDFSNGRVIWNFVNAAGKKIYTPYSMTGMIVAPDADVWVRGNVNGTIVADYVHIEGESHRTDFKGDLTPAQGNLSARKYVNGQTPASDQKFTFKLEKKSGDQWELVETVQNSGSSVTFSTIRYSQVTEILYRISEETAAGYEQNNTQYYIKAKVTQSTGKYWVNYEYYTDEACTQKVKGPEDFVFHNTSSGSPDTIYISGIKNWDDNDNQDGKRNCYVVTVNLYKSTDNGANYALHASAQATESTGWMWSFSNLEKGANICYKIEEVALNNGYTVTYTKDQTSPNPISGINDSTSGIVITNSYTPETVSVKVAKNWYPTNEAHPASVTVYLERLNSADGKWYKVEGNEYTQTLPKGSNDWTYTWSGLPKYNNGNAVQYRVTEEPIAGYNASYTMLTHDDQEIAFETQITNTKSDEPQESKTRVIFTKEWNDADYVDKRPSTIRVVLRRWADTETQVDLWGKVDETFRDVVEISPDGNGNWKYTWENLPEYIPGTNFRYLYYVDEVAFDDNYTVFCRYNNWNSPDKYGKLNANGEGGFDVFMRNTYVEPKTAHFEATKTLKDNNGDTVGQTDKQFAFELTGENGAPMPVETQNGVCVVYSDANGNIVFPNITFAVSALDGLSEDANHIRTKTFTYTIREKNNGADGVIYDDTEYKAQITVSYQSDGDGRTGMNGLTVSEPTYYKVDNGQWKLIENNGKPNFVNTTGAEVVEVTVNKHWVKTAGTNVVVELWSCDSYTSLKQVGTVTLPSTNEKGEQVWSYTWKNLPKFDSTNKEYCYYVKEKPVSGYSTEYKDSNNNSIDYSNVHQNFLINVPGDKVVNIYNTETVKISVNKTWNPGANNNHAIIKLYRDNNQIDTIDLPIHGYQWNYTWDKLPKYDSQGNQYTYYIEEQPLDEYETTYSGCTEVNGKYAVNFNNNTAAVAITNTKLDLVRINVSKHWSDGNQNHNNDSIEVVLKQKVMGSNVAPKEYARQIMQGDQYGNWNITFSRLPRCNENGELYSYYIEEISSINGYVTTYSNCAEDGMVQINGSDNVTVQIVNTKVEYVQLTVNKVWAGVSSDTILPAVTVVLKSNTNGQEVARVELPIVVSGQQVWSHTWDQLPKDTYIIYEEPVEGYEVSYTGDVQNWGNPVVEFTQANQSKTATITNTKDTSAKLTLTKQWDVDDSFNLPTYLSFRVLRYLKNQPDAPAEQVGEFGLNFNYQNHKATYNQNVVADIAEDGSWSYTFDSVNGSKLQTIINNQEYAYRIEEIFYSQPQYNAYYDYETVGNHFITNITNSTNQNITISGTKVWVNDTNSDDSIKQIDGNNVRPDSITVQLYAGETAVEGKSATVRPNESGDWTFSFTELPKRDDSGNEITYTVQESGVPANYVSSTTGNATNGFIITNTYVAPVEAQFVATKTLPEKALDESNRFSFELKENGSVLQTKQNADSGSITFEPITYQLSDLEGASSKTFTYTISEQQGSQTGYTYDSTIYEADVTVTKNSDNTLSVTGTSYYKLVNNARVSVDTVTFVNHYQPLSTSITIPFTKTLENGADNTANRTFTFTLTDEDGSSQTATVEVQANPTSGNSSFTISNLNEVGEFTYTITETDDSETVKDIHYDTATYEVKVKVEDNNGQLQASIDSVTKGGVAVAGNSVAFTNTYIKPVPLTLDATKTLDSNTEAVSLTNGQFSFVLEAKTAGAPMPATVDTDGKVTATNDGDGKVTFDPITYTADQADNTYEYTIKEVVPENPANGYSYDPAVYTVTVKVDKAEDGKSLVVTKTIQKGNEAVNSIQFNNQYVVTNVTGTKTWEDQNNKYEIRPENITLHLWRYTQEDKNDKVEVTGLTPTWEKNGNEWTYTYADLPKYVGNTEVFYYVTEDAVNGYTSDANAINNFTNTLDTFGITGTKEWNDYNNQDGKRPDSITITLKCGEDEVGSIELAAEANDETGVQSWVNGWSFTGLPKYDDTGTAIIYTVTETMTYSAGAPATENNYTTTYKLNGAEATSPVQVTYQENVQNYVVEITNARTPETTTVAVTKNWYGDTGDTSHRPVSIQVKLKNGETVVRTAELNSDNYWKCSWDDLPKYANGQLINYTVEETVEGNWTKYYVAGTPVKAVNSNEYTITNTYVAPVEVVLTATKTLTSESVENKQLDNIFTFELVKGNEVLETVTNAGANVTFEKLTFTKDDVGTHTYTIREKQENTENAAGYTYSTAVYTAEVTVSFENNTLSKSVVYKDAAGTETAPSFENKYESGSASIEIPFSKTLNNAAELAADDSRTFIFGLYECNSETAAQTKTLTFSKTAEGSQSGNFEAINYDKAGTYTYTVKEVVTDKANDIIYDETVYTVTVTVVDNNNGQLEATASYSNGADEPAFTNTYIVPTKAQLTATKAVSGSTTKAVENGKFTFKLLDKQENVVETASNVGTAVTFTEIPYTAAGVYTYYIKEVAGTENYLYDDACYKAVVTVTMDDNGCLQPEIKYYLMNGEQAIDKNAAAFVNRYEETTLTGTKTWSGDESWKDTTRPKNITLKLWRSAKDDTTQKTQVYDVTPTWTKDGTDSDVWTYTYANLPLYVENEEVVYTVEEVPVKGYTSAVATDNANNFINTLDTFDITGTKKWEDGENQDGKRPDSITIKLTAEAIGLNRTVPLTSGNDKNWSEDDLKWSFTGLPKYDEDGDAIIYTITETMASNAEYYTTSYTLNGETATSPVQVTYTEGTNEYKVEIKNAHKPEETEVTVNKRWAGAANSKQPTEIQVTLTPYSGENATVTLKANNWSYTWENLPKYDNGVEINYSVDEVDVPANYIKSVSTNSAENQISYTITNTYVEPIDVKLEATKILTGNGGKTLEAGAFSFQLTGDKLNNAVEAKNDAEGNVTFPYITYTLDDLAGATNNAKTFTYSIQEIVPNPVPAGYTYSPDVYTAEVTISKVEDEELGWKLVSDVKYFTGTGNSKTEVNAADVKFENRYDVDSAKVQFTAVKTLKNADELAEGEERTFTFKLFKGNEATGQLLETKELIFPNANTEQQTATFGSITYEQVGTYTYTVKETETDRYVDIDYDKTVYSVTVEVKDEGGKLVATPTYTAANETKDSLVFENAYIVPTEVKLDATKKLDGATLTNGQFTFELLEGKTSKQTKTNDANGKVSFNSIPYTAADLGDETSKTFTYTIKEKVENKDCYLYDTTEYTVQVTLTKNADHKLVAEVKVNDKVVVGDTSKAITFTNKYDTENVNGTKTWSGDESWKTYTRPENITLHLWRYTTADKNDKVEVTGYTPKWTKNDNSWSYTYSGLPKYVGNTEVFYFVTEELVTGYTSTVAEDNANNFTNTLDTFEIKGTKVWNDNNDQDGKRPDSITITLTADAIDLNRTVTLTSGDDEKWSDDERKWSFTGLPKYHKNGDAITYTVTETINYAEGTVEADQDYSTTYKLGDADMPEDGITCENNDDVTITNSRETDKTSIKVEKVWLDGNETSNRSEIRVQLKANNVNVGEAVALNTENDWTYTWENQEVNDEDGKKITYTVEELTTGEGEEPAAWTQYYQQGVVKINDNINFTITNTLLTEVTVEKTWDDQGNKYETRPESITVYLWQNNAVPKANDEPYAEATVKADDEGKWSYTFEKLPKYDASNNAYTYTVTEAAVTGYVGTVTEGTVTEGTYTINNKLETVNIPVTKIWDDNSNQDGKRPDEIKLILKADGVQLKTETISAKNHGVAGDNNQWSYTFTDLPKYDAEGNPIKYSVKEKVTYTDGFVYTNESNDMFVANDEGKLTLTNSYQPKTVDITVEKSWTGDDAYTNNRPASVKVQLMRSIEGGTAAPYGDEVALNSGNNWSHTFEDLPQYKDGQLITYSVQETVSYAEGYVYTSTLPAGITQTGKLTVENKLETVDVPVTKTWDGDEELYSATRPESITVYLWQNNAEPKNGDVPYAQQVITVGESDEWSYTFTGLPKYKTIDDNGQKIENVYTVTEEPVPGYNTTINDYAITNTLELINIDVIKVWNTNNTNEATPDSITVQLMQKVGEAEAVAYGDEVMLTSTDAWKHTFQNLPTHNNAGQAYTYSVQEVAVDGYTSTVGELVQAEDGTYSITLTNTIQTTELTVDKVWLNGEGEDPVATVQLVRSIEGGTAVPYGDEVALNSDNNWTYTFENLPTHNKNGKAYGYTVVETPIDDYASNVGEVANNKVTVTNTELTEVKVSKVWENITGKDLPEKIVIELLANGDSLNPAQTVELVPVDNGRHGEWTTGTFTNLPKYDADNKLITYSVQEITELEGYVDNIVNVDNNDYEFQVTNTFTPDKTQLKVTKVWEDNNNVLQLRPTEIEVKLMVTKEGGTATPYGDEVVLNSDNNWTDTFEDLPVEIDGVSVSYSVEEVLTDDAKRNGYVLTSNEVVDNDATITNTLDVVDIQVIKDWQDDENRDHVRPTSLKVTLMANDSTVGEAELNSSNQWTYTWENLPKSGVNGVEIDYTVEETVTEEMTEKGYTFKGTSESGYAFTIVNERSVDTFNLNGTKLWNDNNDQDGNRPVSITIALEVLKVTPAADGGEAVTEWVPATHADGTAVEPEIISNLEGVSQTWSFTNLPVNKKGGLGEKLTYRVVETMNFADGKSNEYTTTYAPETIVANGNDQSVTITNAYTPDVTDITVNKHWADSNDVAQVRPAQVELQLMKKGADGFKPVDGKTITLTSSNALADNANVWSSSFTGLDKYENGGVPIEYAVKETFTVGDIRYTYIVTNDDIVRSDAEERTIDLTNTLELVDISVEKIWDDQNNKYGSRPESITIKLWQINAQPSEEDVLFDTLTLRADSKGNWKHTFENLPKLDENGVSYTYTVTEEVDYTNLAYKYSEGNAVPVTPAEGIEFAYKFNNSLELTDLTGTKTWDDQNNAYGTRNKLTLTIYANGSKLLDKDGKEVTFTVSVPQNDNSKRWDWSYTDLPKCDAAGNEIAYTVVEADVPGYTNTTAAETPNVLKNTLVTTNVVVTKIWDDSNNQDGKRPDEITLILKADGVQLKTETINAADHGVAGDSNQWRYTFERLPKYRKQLDEEGKLVEIVYTVEEAVTGKDGKVYTGTTAYGTDEAGNTTVEITNSCDTEKISITVNKVWKDNDNSLEKRPKSIKVYLMKKTNNDIFVNVKDADNQPVYKVIDSSLTCTFEGLDKYENGVEIEYTVSESVEFVDGYYYGSVVGENVDGVITLTNTLEVVDVEVTKKWEGDSGNSQYRPDSIMVYLWQNTVGNNVEEAYASKKVDTVTGTQQTVSFNNLPKYDIYGQPITYKVTEGVDYSVKGYGYTTENSEWTVVNGKAAFTNKLETIELNGKKVWNDASNAFNTRPEQISIVVMNGDAVVVTKSFNVTTADEFTWTITDLPKYDEDHQEITYTIVEEAVKGYEDGIVTTETVSEEIDGETVDTAQYVVTNNLDTVDVSGTKKWDDKNNQDGKRPEQITINLLNSDRSAVTKMVNGQAVALTQTITAADASEADASIWNWEFTDLPKYEPNSNTLKNYTVSETITYADGTKEQDKYSTQKIDVRVDEETRNVSAEIVNAYQPETTNVSVIKIWNDDNNRDAVRPEKLTITLTGKVGDETVVTKTYDLTGDMLGDQWSYTFENLDKFHNGNVISYDVAEEEIDGYIPISKTGNANDGYTLTNKHETSKLTVNGSKVWMDDSNRDGIRPTEIKLTLMSDDPTAEDLVITVTPSADETNTWSFTTDELPKYMVELVDGRPVAKEITYTLAEEIAYNGYSSNVEGYVVTNTHIPEVTNVKVTKVWSDDEDRDDVRPDDITVKLTAKVNGVEVEDLCQTQVLSEANNWTYTFENLFVKHEGKTVVYTVDEESVPEGYTKSGPVEVDSEEENVVSYELTNKHDSELVTIAVHKVWNDNNNQDGKQPASVKVQLYKKVTEDGVEKNVNIGNPVTLDQTNGWKHTFDSATLNLYRNEKGIEIQYGIEEVDVPTGYKCKVELVETVDDEDHKTYSYTVTNTHEIEKTKVVITKTWDDNNNQDGKRESVTFALYANGTATEKKVTLEDLADNSWTYTFENLDRYVNGLEIKYSVKEETVIDGYTTTGTDPVVKKDANAETVTTYVDFTNKHEPEKTKVVVNKVWDDDSNRDGKRTSIQLQLLADGKELGAPVTLSETEPASNTWTYTFENLDVYTNGVKIKYTVKEITKIDGYETTTDVKVIEPVQATDTEEAVEGMTAITITNKHEPSEISIDGVKTWNDDNNRDGKRPASIQIILKADGVEKTAVTVTAEDQWAWKFTDLPEYRTGKVGEKIVYTVTEVLTGETATKYTATVDGYNITNSYTPETVQISGSKTWNDLNNKYLKRPDSVTIRLLADGTEIDHKVVTEADNWSWTFTGLPKYKAGEVGKEVVYTITEDVVTGYITTVEDYNVTNAMNMVEFIKTDEQTGKRLAGAKFALYEGALGTYDESKPVETWVSDLNTKMLTGLKVGQTYTIVETEAPSGYAMMTPFQFTVQLTDIPGTYRAFSVSNCHVYRFRKLDSSNNGLVYGAKLAVLDGNNAVIESWVTSDANGGWYEIADHRLVAGKEYRLVELEAPFGYELADPITFSVDEEKGMLVVNDSYTAKAEVVMYDNPIPEATPTPEPTTTSYSVTKRWEDKDNVLGLRPSSITVHLYRKLRTEAEYPAAAFMTVHMNSNGKNVWNFTFEDLPRRSEDGILYDYTIVEEPVEGYVTSYLNNGKTIVNSIPVEDFPPTPTPTLPYVTPTPSPMPRVPAGVQFIDGEWMYIDEYGIPLGGIPLTGDNTNFILWGMAIGLPLLVAALAAVEIRRRKKLLAAAEQEEEVEDFEE